MASEQAAARRAPLFINPPGYARQVLVTTSERVRLHAARRGTGIGAAGGSKNQV